LGTQTGEACLSLAAALERGSEHPIARAILTAAASPGAASLAELRNYPGRGIEARINGDRVRIGSPAFVSELSSRPLPAERPMAADDSPAVLLGDERGYLALFTFADAVRPGAGWMVRELEARGMTVCLLSGDRRATVTHVGRKLGIATVAGEAGPEAKLAFVQDLQARGARVAMVGDGINDAPVLARAQVSIAMGSATDLAHASADMVLVGDDLARLPAAFDIARTTMHIIRQNLAWAVAYNAVAIPLAAGGLITPLIAGAGMAVSSLVVVLNALRLQAVSLPVEPPADVRRHGDPAAATP
jgi:Cu2+-exporting ATPase